MNKQDGFNGNATNNIFYKTTNGGNDWIKHHHDGSQAPIVNPNFLSENTGYSATAIFSV